MKGKVGAPRGVSRAGEADFEAFAIRSRILGAAQIFTTFAHCLVRRLSSRTVPRERSLIARPFGPDTPRPRVAT